MTRAENRAAERRAKTLLLRYLSPAQAWRYRLLGSFKVQTNGGIYKLSRGRVWYGVKWQSQKNKKWYRGCVDTRDDVPDSDQILTFLLWIRANEIQFHNTVNWSS